MAIAKPADDANLHVSLMFPSHVKTFPSMTAAWESYFTLSDEDYIMHHLQKMARDKTTFQAAASVARASALDLMDDDDDGDQCTNSAMM